MAPSGSKKRFLVSGEGSTAEGDSKASSSSGTGQPAEEDSGAFSIPGDGASAREEHPEDENFSTCAVQKSKRPRREMTDTISSRTKLDPGMWSVFDDFLLEKIFARLPVKSLFQVASLSKFWKARFASSTFRSEVHSSLSTSTRSSYTPLFENHEKELMGYDNASKQWHRLPSHSYLERNVVREWSLKAAAGSLLCWTCPDGLIWTNVFDIHVTNPLTKKWRQLPPRPNMTYPQIVQIDLEEGSKAYKVLVGTLKPRQALDDRSSVRVQIYDSTDNSWTMETFKIGVNCAVRLGGSTLRNGVLYVFLSTLEKNASCSLLSFQVNQRKWTEIPDLRLIGTQDLLLKYCYAEILFSQLFSCKSDVMLVLHQIASSDTNAHCEGIGAYRCVAYEKLLSVFRLDLQRGAAFEVSRDTDSHLEMADGAASSLSSAAGQDDCVYIGGNLECPCLFYNIGSQQRQARDFPRKLYNVRTKQWQRLNPPHDWSRSNEAMHVNRWRSISVVYQPGLNPFQEV